jgi:hypothetical protein
MWAALGESHPTGEEQRCWNHKLTNVFDALPKKAQAIAVERLKAVPYADTQAEWKRQRDAFVCRSCKTDPKAVDTLLRDWDRMVTVYAFPKEHWIPLRTTHSVESPLPPAGFVPTRLVAPRAGRAPRPSWGKSSGWPRQRGATSMRQHGCHSSPPACRAMMEG